MKKIFTIFWSLATILSLGGIVHYSYTNQYIYAAIGIVIAVWSGANTYLWTTDE